MDVEVLQRIEKLARTLRYRTTRECIPPAALEHLSDRQLAAQIVVDATTIVTDATEAEH